MPEWFIFLQMAFRDRNVFSAFEKLSTGDLETQSMISSRALDNSNIPPQVLIQRKKAIVCSLLISHHLVLIRCLHFTQKTVSLRTCSLSGLKIYHLSFLIVLNAELPTCWMLLNGMEPAANRRLDSFRQLSINTLNSTTVFIVLLSNNC